MDSSENSDFILNGSLLPSHWDAVQVGGIYLGSEIWGRGFLDWEVKELTVFSMKNEIN